MPMKRTLREAPSRDTQMVSPSTTFVTAHVPAELLERPAGGWSAAASGFGVAVLAAAATALVEVAATSVRVAAVVSEPRAAFAPMAASPTRAAIVRRPLVLRLRIVLPVPWWSVHGRGSPGARPANRRWGGAPQPSLSR